MSVRVRVAIAVLAAALAGGARPAAAEDESVVAVLPLAAGESHGLYAKPVADELARQLRGRAGMPVESLSLAGSVPARIALVIDGRIIDAGRRTVALEARVRDPRRGTTMVETVATRARPVGEIDVLAADLAGALAPKLAAAIVEQRKRAAAEAEVVRIKKPDEPKVDPGPTEQPATPDPRPVMLILRARADGAEVETLTRQGFWMAERLGYRPIGSEQDAAVKPALLPQLMAAAGAQYALAIDVLAVKFEKRGVLTARGRTHVVLCDQTGRPLFDRIARTGTLVGSRGDGPAALVHFVGEQTADIVYPYLKKLVGR